MTKKPASFDELYPGRFLKAALLRGKPATLTISDVDIEELVGDDGAKRKAILSFSETPLKLVLCRTNGECIRAMFGSELAKWIGKKVTIHESQWNGEPCIRVLGSPDITASIQAVVKLPRKKPITMTMQKV